MFAVLASLTKSDFILAGSTKSKVHKVKENPVFSKIWFLVFVNVHWNLSWSLSVSDLATQRKPGRARVQNSWLHSLKHFLGTHICGDEDYQCNLCQKYDIVRMRFTIRVWGKSSNVIVCFRARPAAKDSCFYKFMELRLTSFCTIFITLVSQIAASLHLVALKKARAVPTRQLIWLSCI